MDNSFTIAQSREAFDFERIVVSGQTFRWTCSEGDVWSGVDGQNVFRVVRNKAGLNVESNAERGAFERLFRLDYDTERMRAELLAVEPRLAPAFDALPGFRIIRSSDPVETLFSFLCTANNHLARIGPMVRTLASYGEPLAYGERRFPSVERIAAIPELELRSKGFGYRAKSIPIVAQEVLIRGDRWLEDLKTAGYDTAWKELTSLPSVGRKLADCVALYGLGYDEAAPLDVHLWNAVCELYYPDWRDKALTDSRYREAGEALRDRFGDRAGWAHAFLYYHRLTTWRTAKLESK